nr:MAG TPA: hypothetical protein [Caudoviricetes sp.]
MWGLKTTCKNQDATVTLFMWFVCNYKQIKTL